MNLKEYLQIVYELESSVFQQEQLIGALEARCNIGAPPKPFENRSTTSSTLKGVLFCFLSLACFLLPIILFGVSVNAGAPLAILFLLLLPLGIYFGIRLIRWAIDCFKETSQAVTSNEQFAKQHYYNSIEYTRKWIECQSILFELPGLKSKADQSRKLLIDFYNCNIIHPNYRTLVPICSINNYVQTGICSTLEGPHGAYSRFEYEKQMNAIIDRLDIVISKLNAIQQNQELLYRAVQESNRISSNILQSIQDFSTRALNKFDQINGRLNSIEKNQHISNYTANLIRKEIAYRNYLTHGTTYRHWKY